MKAKQETGQRRKLTLTKETLRSLTPTIRTLTMDELRLVAGGRAAASRSCKL